MAARYRFPESPIKERATAVVQGGTLKSLLGGALIGVAQGLSPIQIGEDIEWATEGQYELDAPEALVLADGADVEVNLAGTGQPVVASGGTVVGKAVGGKLSGAKTVLVRLNA
ncbi:MAG: DUF2190 family protein [Planctomycetota bacterium]